jgi:hypothetical protein
MRTLLDNDPVPNKEEAFGKELFTLIRFLDLSGTSC